MLSYSRLSNPLELVIPKIHSLILMIGKTSARAIHHLHLSFLLRSRQINRHSSSFSDEPDVPEGIMIIFDSRYRCEHGVTPQSLPTTAIPKMPWLPTVLGRHPTRAGGNDDSTDSADIF